MNYFLNILAISGCTSSAYSEKGGCESAYLPLDLSVCVLNMVSYQPVGNNWLAQLVEHQEDDLGGRRFDSCAKRWDDFSLRVNFDQSICSGKTETLGRQLSFIIAALGHVIKMVNAKRRHMTLEGRDIVQAWMQSYKAPCGMQWQSNNVTVVKSHWEMLINCIVSYWLEAFSSVGQLRYSVLERLSSCSCLPELFTLVSINNVPFSLLPWEGVMPI